MVAILTDAEGRAPSSEARIESIKADLRGGAGQELAQIDLLIRRTENCQLNAECCTRLDDHASATQLQRPGDVSAMLHQGGRKIAEI